MKFSRLPSVIQILLFGFLINLFAPFGLASTTKVGNGDDGTDLENLKKLEKGLIVSTRKKAVDLLRELNVKSIQGLGTLVGEVGKTELYLSQVKVPNGLTGDDKSDIGLNSNEVYARTMPRPGASTRFFPMAMELDEDQLIALHIHEGLHRSLPKNLREDEKYVSKVTLAIVDPDASRDTVESIVLSVPETESIGSATSMASRKAESFWLGDGEIENPSTVGYALRTFTDPDRLSLYPVGAMHMIRSMLYPFGSSQVPIGLGIEFSWVKTPESMYMGPLSLSGRVRVYSSRAFDVGLFGQMSLNTLSDEEIKSSQFGRDVTTLGLAVEKKSDYFYVQNELSYSSEGETKEKIGNLEYTYEYGSITAVRLRAGARIFSVFHIGPVAELFLSDYFRVKGGAFAYDPGRFRILAVGPEFKYQNNNFYLSAVGRFLINSTKGADFDLLGDLMGVGTAQGGVTFSAGVLF